MPAFLEINDIAGLVRGANEGQGLGNAFLSHIRAVDGIFHVLSKCILNFCVLCFCCFLLFSGMYLSVVTRHRSPCQQQFSRFFVSWIAVGAFDDPEVTHVEDSVDPVRDLEIISAELRLKVSLFTVT